MLKAWIAVQNGIVRTLCGWSDVRRRQEGQGMVEYGLIIALVAIGLVVALGLMKDQIVAVFTNITTTLQGATTTTP